MTVIESSPAVDAEAAERGAAERRGALERGGLVRRGAWWVAVLAGLVLLVAGPVMVAVGMQGKSEVRAQLRQEKIVTPPDAAIPNARVDDAATAQAQADVIWKHMMKASGGKTYAELERSDPRREVLALGDSLRSALLASALAWNVANLVIGLGILVAGVGLVLAVVGLAIRPTPARRSAEAGGRR